MENHAPVATYDDMPVPVRLSQPLLFATGIENSYPVIAGPYGAALRRDQMAACGHYQRWREDFAPVRGLGLRYLRYGTPYCRAHLGPGRYEWDVADAAFNELRRLEIVPIAAVLIAMLYVQEVLHDEVVLPADHE